MVIIGRYSAENKQTVSNKISLTYRIPGIKLKDDVFLAVANYIVIILNYTVCTRRP